jgi:hypothetical protein
LVRRPAFNLQENISSDHSVTYVYEIIDKSENVKKKFAPLRFLPIKSYGPKDLMGQSGRQVGSLLFGREAQGYPTGGLIG